MIKTNCELPLDLLFLNTILNDYDMVLFHLYASNPKYRSYYQNLRKTYPERMMILDNSAYEFYIKGENLDVASFKQAINELKPDFYIVPDVLMNALQTIQYFHDWLDYIKQSKSQALLVLQGNSEKEMMTCFDTYCSAYRNLGLGTPNICIPFHNSFFKTYPCSDHLKKDILKEYNIKHEYSITEDHKYAFGRISFVYNNLESLCSDSGHIHFLGSHCPAEKITYNKLFEYKYSVSMDTGYPVKLGLRHVALGEEKQKPNIIIDDFLDAYLTTDDKVYSIINIDRFKKY